MSNRSTSKTLRTALALCALGCLLLLAAAARGEAELYALLRRMLGSLRDPHTRVYPPGESTDWRVHRYVSVGVAVRQLGGQIVVTDVERDSEARRAGVRAGDAVLALDGEPVA